MASEKAYINKIDESRDYYVDGRACTNQYLKPKSTNVQDGPNTPIISGFSMRPDESGIFSL